MQSTSTPAKPKRGLLSFVMIGFALLYFVILGCVVGYVWLVAQDRFVSSSSFKISRQNLSAAEPGFAQMVLPGLADSGSVDSQIAIGFIDSTDMLQALETEFKLREHYASPEHDFFFRLDVDEPLEVRLKYYRKRISGHFDKETGLTVLTVDTFDPELSKKLADVILQRTDQFINRLNQTVADQQLHFIRGEVSRSEKLVSELSVEMLTLQNTHNIVSPEEAITGTLKALQDLKMELLRIETTLSSLERDSPESPRIPTLRSQARSLREQIAIETTKVSGPEQDRLNQILARYKDLEIRLGFAQQMKTGAETLLEKHRVDAAAASRFILIIQHPFLPDGATYPQRPYASATIIALGILLFLILRVMVQAAYERGR
jgi:capsular polysaccharide transport system permease protein